MPIKKVIIFLSAFLFILLTSVAIFWNSIQMYWIDHSLRAYCQKCGYVLSAESSIEGNQLLLKDISLKDQNNAEISSIKYMEIKAVSAIWDREILFKILLDSPQLSLEPFLSKNYQENVIKALAPFKWLRPIVKLEVVDGQLNLPQEKSAFFKGHLLFDRSLSASTRVLFPERNRAFYFTFDKQGNARKIQMQAENVESHFFNQIIQLFQPHMKEWNFEEGAITGFFDLSHDGVNKITDCHIALKDGIISSKSDKKIYLPSLTCEIKKNEGYLIFDLPAQYETKHFALTSILGEIKIASLENNPLHLEAVFNYDTHKIPLKIKGTLFSQIEKQWAELICEATFAHLPLLKKSCLLTAHCYRLEDESCYIEGDCQYDDKMPYQLTFMSRDDHKEEGWLVWLLRNSWKVKEAFFQCKELDLFNFSNTLQGKIGFEARYKDHLLALGSDLKDFTYHHPNFELHIPQIPFSYTYNFLDSTNEGRASIENGILNYGKIGLSDLSCQLLLNNKVLSLVDCEGVFQNEKIKASLTTDWSNILENHLIFTGKIYPIHITVSDIKNKFSKDTTPDFFSKIPLEGDLFLFEDQADAFKLEITPQNVITEVLITGKLRNGFLNNLSVPFAVHNMDCLFEYHIPSNRLSINKIHGDLKINSMPVYAFEGDSIVFENLTTGKGHFDIWVGDRLRDMLRAKGEINPVQSSPFNFIEITLDPYLSHFGHIPLNNLNILLKEWSHIELFHLNTQLNLKSLTSDLQYLNCCPETLLKMIQPFEGQCDLQLNYLANQDLLTYSAIFNNFSIKGYPIQNVLLKGKMRDHFWSIEQLKWDDVSFSSDFSHINEKIWKVNFLGIQKGKSFLLGLEGVFDSDLGLFDSKIHLLEIAGKRLPEMSNKKCIFSFGLNPFNIKASMNETVLGKPITVSLKSELPSFDVVDFNIETPLESSLNIKCLKKNDDSYSIAKILGSYDEMKIDLTKKDDGYFFGSIESLKTVPFSNLFSNKFDFSGEFKLTGLWKIDDMLNRKEMTFSGQLLGKNGKIWRIPFQLLSGECSFQNKKWNLENLNLIDGKAHLEASRLEFLPENSSLAIHSLKGTQLKIPLLESYPEPYLDQVEIANLFYNFGQMEQNQGEGEFHFSHAGNWIKNSIKQENPVLEKDIPLSTLIPDTGTVYFQINGNRINIARLKETYSIGKTAKFILGKKEPSFVSIDGSMHLSLRTKQHNLRFKIADLFNITLNGSIYNPQLQIDSK